MPAKLKNGARVLIQCGDKVLCHWNGKWVVWTIDYEGNTFWGHYFDNGNDAVEYMAKRLRIKGIKS